MRRIPVFRQTESSDCGPVCLQMISAFYGKQFSLRKIKSFCDITKLGISIRELIFCAQNIGLTAKSLKISVDDLYKAPLPAILFWKEGHYVVLEKIRTRGSKPVFVLVDPDYGRLEMEKEDFETKWSSNNSGVIIVLAPSENFDTIPDETDLKPKGKRVIDTILDLYKKHRKKLILSGFLTLLVMAMNWSMPLLLKMTVDDGILSGNIHVVWMILLCQLVFFIGFIVFNNITTYILTKTGFRIGITLTKEYLEKIVDLPMVYFDRTFKSHLIQRLSDQERIANFIIYNVNTILFTVLNIVIFSVILCYFNYIIFLLFAFFSISSICYNAFFLRKRKYLDYSHFNAHSIQRNNVYEMVMGMSELKIHNAQQQKISIWEKLQNRINGLTLRKVFLGYYMNNGSLFFNRLKDITITGLSALLVINGEMTLGTMLTISYLLGMLSGPLNEMYAIVTDIQDIKLSHNRLQEVMEIEESEISGHAIISDHESITVDKLSFKYSGTFNEDVLRDISLCIPAGKITAIVGNSGSGKTTLLKLLLGFYKPRKGKIYIGDTSIENIDLGKWRERCGVVMQDGYIFSGTIAENIAIAEDCPDYDRLVVAAKTACIYDFIEKLPMGFYTNIGESGINMSGGQKQRLFIARALYKNPSHYFFDEATSSLDANNEKQILKNLKEVYKNKTVVIIAHRLSTVKHADQIVYMKDGYLTEIGTHEQLIKLRGSYYHLIQNQLDI